MGERPHTYSIKKTRHFSEQAVARFYELIAADSFEEGDAYSLHATSDAAKGFKPQECWQWAGGPETVYVSRFVLEEINKKRGKSVFIG